MTTTKSNESVILVTGATGTVGSEVVKQLLSAAVRMQTPTMNQEWIWQHTLSLFQQ